MEWDWPWQTSEFRTIQFSLATSSCILCVCVVGDRELHLISLGSFYCHFCTFVGVIVITIITILILRLILMLILIIISGNA